VHPFSQITSLQQGLARGDYSSRELTEFYLERVKRLNPRSNCYITLCEERALRQADAADQRIRNGAASPITGIPLAHKDIFCTSGVATTCGSRMLETFVAPYDATGTKSGFPEAPPGVRRRLWPGAWRQLPPAPTPAGPSGNRRLFAACRD
jgi:aspartyl-tRNA(Asn)/glutamyl-tRNA(Gln) amidotransferase subunit A